MTGTREENGTKAKVVLFHQFFSILLALAFVVEMVNICLRLPFSNLLEAILLLLACMSTIAALTRQLPLQNVLLAAFGIAFIGGGAVAIGANTGIPFGPISFEIEPRILRMSWAMPLIWIAGVLNSRGTARLILRPWRKTKTYGFWLIGMTAVLVMVFDVTMEPFAHLRHFWLWTAPKIQWQDAPVSNFFAWFFVTLLILTFITPALINKQLSKRRKPDLYPLFVWMGAIVIFATACANHGNWLATGIDAAIGIVAATFAIRGAKW